MSLKEDYIITREHIQKISDRKHLKFCSHAKNLEGMISKANIMRLETIELTPHMYAMIKRDSIEVISDGQICLPEVCEWLFFEMKFRSIDFHGVNSDDVRIMRTMLCNTNMDYIDFTGFNTENVITMNGMFSGVEIKYLDISMFNTEKLLTTKDMFKLAEIDRLKLGDFKIKHINNKRDMFSYSEIKEIEADNKEVLEEYNNREQLKN